MTTQRHCFVIMPFSATKSKSEAEWTEIYENVFKPAVEACCYTCDRAEPMMGRLAQSIIEKLRNSFLVLADITDRNANVFYELGVRHSLSRRTIIVAQGSEHAPSDLKGYWFTIYGTSPGQVSQFKREIKRLVGLIENNPEQSDNPVSDYLEQAHLDVSRYRNIENLRKLSALFTEVSGNILSIETIEKWLSQHGNSDQVLSLLGEELTGTLKLNPNAPLAHTECLQYLLTSYYIDPGPDFLRSAYEIRYKLDFINNYGFDRETLDVTLGELKEFRGRIESIKESMSQGRYVEPDSVSVMVWKPIEGVPEVLRSPNFLDVAACRSFYDDRLEVLLKRLSQGDKKDSGS